MSPSTHAREIDLFVPLHYNDGRPVEAEKLHRIQQRLVDRFGGLTDLRHRSEGHWKVGGITFQDEIVIYRVLAQDDAIDFLVQLKEDMKRDLEQEDVLMVGRAIDIL